MLYTPLKPLVLLFFVVALSSCNPNNDVESLLSHEHNYVIVNGVEPTCTDYGISDKVYCSECGYVFQDHEDIKPLGHNPVISDEKKPGISFDGHSSYTFCDRCGTIMSDIEQYEKISVKNEIASYTHDDGTIDFELFIHRKELNYDTHITVSYLDVVEQYNQHNDNRFTYSKMAENTIYNFTFETKYEDGDEEEKIVLTRYYNTIKTSLPDIYVETENFEWPSHKLVSAPEGCWGKSQTDNTYVQCGIDFYDNDGNAIFTSHPTMSDFDYSGAKIKLRGNTSSYKEKAPYKIKLNKKTDLLSNVLHRNGKEYEDKEWLLLSTNSIKTYLGFYINYLLSGENRLNGAFVSLFINGDYRGIYFLSESISKGNVVGDKASRIDITDSGFIVEDDAYWWNEEKHFETLFMDGAMRYTFKYPDPDKLTAEQTLYIKNNITAFEEALLQEGDDYLNYIDIDSFAAWILTHDLLGTYDTAGSNIFIIKRDDKDSKLNMGPCWDFDFDIQSKVDSFYYGHYAYYLYYKDLFKKRSFIDAYIAMFERIKDSLVTELDNYALSFDKNSFDEDYSIDSFRWGLERNNSPFNDQYNYLEDYIESKLLWIPNHLDDL